MNHSARRDALNRGVRNLGEHAQQLADATDQQALLVDLDPGPRRGREDDVVATADRHLDANVVPPVQSRPDGQHDAVLGWRLVVAGRRRMYTVPSWLAVAT